MPRHHPKACLEKRQGPAVHLCHFVLPRVADVFVPRLTITSSYDLKKMLSHLGISKIFEEHGDLTRISPHRNLKVDEVSLPGRDAALLQLRDPPYRPGPDTLSQQLHEPRVPPPVRPSLTAPNHLSVQFSSVAQSCPTLCDPMSHSTPGLPVHPGQITYPPKPHVSSLQNQTCRSPSPTLEVGSVQQWMEAWSSHQAYK